MFTRSMRGAATITSPAVSSAMLMTPSSITRDSGPMISLSSASARVSISSAFESGPGWMNSATFCRKGALVLLFVRGARRVGIRHSREAEWRDP